MAEAQLLHSVNTHLPGTYHMPVIVLNVFKFTMKLLKHGSQSSQERRLLVCLLPLNLGWGTSLAVQPVRLHAFIAGGTGLIPDQGTKIPHATQCDLKRKKESLL